MMVDELRAGGAERFAVALASEIDHERFDVVLVVTRRGEWPDERAHVLRRGVDLLELGRGSTLEFGPWLRLARFLRDHDVDVLHAHKFGSNVWASIVGRAAGVPVVIATEHTWSFEGQRLRRVLDRRLVGRATDVTVAVSEADRERMIAVERIAPDHIRVIPTGLVPPLDRPPARAADLRGEVGAPPGALLVLTACQLRPQKALEVLLEAHASLRERVPAVLVIAGDGPERGRLEAHSRTLGDDAVHFLGERDDVASLLAQCDVFAMSSDNEGTPLALIEAMSAGRAIVATDVGGIPAMTPDRECALLVPARDPAALADALTRLARDPALRERLGSRALRRSGEYAFPRVVAAWQDLYVELLAARSAPAA
jgi:glycosyltransferase involved in cell wall biosynthesis